MVKMETTDIRIRTVRFAAVSMAVLLAAGPCLADGQSAITRPSKDIILAFLLPGQIAQVAVVEGQRVKKGQLLMRQDDEPEQKQLAVSKFQAEDTTRIEAAIKQGGLRQVIFQRTDQTYRQQAATKLERDQAEVEWEIAKLSLKLARFQQKLDQLRYQADSLQLRRMRIHSPIDGRVENVQVEVGESVDKLTPVVRVVQTDPLWVDVAVPAAVAARLQPGQPASARVNPARYDPELTDKDFPLRYKLAAGKIKHISTVADAASNTRRVRVELPNPENVPAGLHVLVDFPQQEEAATDSQPSRTAKKTQP